MYTEEKKKRRRSEQRGFGGILDFSEIRKHKVEGFTDEQNAALIRQTRNFENAHLRAYLKGWTYFNYHGNIFKVLVNAEKEE